MYSFQNVSKNYFNSLDKKFIKNNGVAYTPDWIAAHIITTAFKQWEKFNAGCKPKSVADICCGTGVFIKNLDEHISANKIATKISAFDIDKNAINLAVNYFKEKDSVECILCKDSLTADVSEKYDIIVGNPPYVNSKEIEDSYKKYLSNEYYSASSGLFDLAIVFVEKTLRMLNENGVGCLIISNKFMTSKYGKYICEILSEKCNIIKIEDFNDLQLFDGLTTYTCIITFINTKPAKRHTLSIADIDNDNRIISMPKMSNETIKHEELKKHPWNFYKKEDSDIIRKFHDYGVSILDVFSGIQQGIRTGANDVFILNKDDVKLFNNSPLIYKYVSGEDIVSIKMNDTKQNIIYPYKQLNGTSTSFSDHELKTDHNEIYQYLLKKKNPLENRSLQGNTQWYEFSRSQSLNSVYSRKILIREMMPQAIFSADIKGEYVFSSGYALIGKELSDDELVAWALILSTPVMEFIMRHVGTQLHSGWFRLMKNHIANLPLPKIDKVNFNLIVSETNKKDINFEKVNSIVAMSFCLSDIEIDFIKTKIDKIHNKSKPKNKNVSKENDDIYEPVKLEKFNNRHVDREDLKQAVTFSQNKKIPIHNWYKYTQGFSPSLVNFLLDEFNVTTNSIVLDPFNGCGTTVVTCAYRGIPSIGIEISPLMCLITKIKARKWDIEKLRTNLDYEFNVNNINNINNKDLVFNEYFNKAYSKKILDAIKSLSTCVMNIKDDEVNDFYTIALLSILEDVSKIRKHGSHYRYLDNANSVGLQKVNINVISEDADVLTIFKNSARKIYDDICTVGGNPKENINIINESSLNTSIESNSIDVIITSPPYLNRNNYISQQKSELDILGMITDKVQYKKLVKSTFRSHTDSNLAIDPRSKHSEVNVIIDNMQLEKGNNPKIPHMICGYFDDLESSLKECYRLLKVGGQAAFVVGNTRWGGVVVPIDHLLAKFAEDIGFSVDTIFVTRLKGNSPQQMKRFGKISVRESIVILRKIS